MLAQYAAVKDRLESDTALAGKVHSSARVHATDGTLLREQYVILFGGPPDELDDDRLTSLQRADSDAEFVYPIRSVSVTADGALAVAAKVTDRLVGFTPTIPGRSCRIWLDSSDEVLPDNSIVPPLFYVDQTFILRSTRA